MILRIPAWTFVSATVLFSGLGAEPVHAQGEPEGPAKAQQVRAVERGFVLETEVGAYFRVNELGGRRYGLGFLTGFHMGYDIAPFLSVLVGASAISAPSAPDTPQGLPSDLFFLSPQAALQVALITSERNFLWVRGGGGLAFALPEQVNGQTYGEPGPMFTGSVGFERYTKLRHFSIGVQVGATIFLKPELAVGITVAPLLKYTF